MTDIQYKWEFTNFNIVYNENNMTNVINKVLGRIEATYTVNNVLIRRITNIFNIAFPPPESTNFISFENISPQIITTWAESILGEERISTIKSQLSGSVADAVSKLVVIPTEGMVSPPWENPTPAPPEPIVSPEENFNIVPVEVPK